MASLVYEMLDHPPAKPEHKGHRSPEGLYILPQCGGVGAVASVAAP